MTEQQPWQWDEQTWRGHVARVRAGRSLHPASWPGGARVAVALSFDCDHETSFLRVGQTGPGPLAQGEYGSRVGSRRVLGLLERFGVPASFFMPAVSGLLHPEEVRDYVAAGHEIGMHGWIHESNAMLDPADERELALRAADTLEKLSGTRPVGIRTPAWDFSDHTLAITRELGLRYDSSLMADDEPYELLADGEPTGVVEIPVEWIRDDVPYLLLEFGGMLRPCPAPRDVAGIWRDEFDAALEEGGLFQLTMHPQVIGHRSRMTVLRELLEHIDAQQGVWYATHAQIAEYVLNRAS
ncbi:polysaccharide deacetylase [Actinomadura sp. NAK00032]|uniref:polysaccharide deacetylase family protein n=1 Tax=Actinomadura sp. NAK00032 TaxID=2742128 RepID=UPI001591D010|nr:polysaccharide deacetylase [Actinomadura sp. NAK00032]QKW33178.1 polysaccharide deacetylase [Actinomadura sp. NAK00032]